MIASFRFKALLFGAAVYLIFSLLIAGVFVAGAQFYPFTFSTDNTVMFIGIQLFRTFIIAVGAYVVAKKADPVSFFNVVVYSAVIVVSVFVASLFSGDSFYLEKILSAVSTAAGAYLGYSFFQDYKVENNKTGEQV